MAIWETFSKRKKRESGDVADVYQYDQIPGALRVQVIHIWSSAIGHVYQDDLWKSLHDIVARELGVFNLGKSHETHFAQCQQYIQTATIDGVLDIIEVTFSVIDGYLRKKWPYSKSERSVTQDADGAIEELNHRFKEHSVGYQFESGKLIRIDSQHLHAEVVKPALQLLAEPRFAGAQEEFLKAHEHYRHGRQKEAVAEALKSFESVMKVIADKRKWAYPPGAPAKKLIEVMLANGLIPASLQSELSALSTVLESGLPTVRNKTSGHGQGGTPIELPTHVAAYALHLAAANILLLTEAEKALK